MITIIHATSICVIVLLVGIESAEAFSSFLLFFRLEIVKN